mgnify:CR=1 FL=1
MEQMETEYYVMGIDAGTQGVRVALVDLTGVIVSLADEAYPIYYPRPGWAEQEIGEIWRSTVKAVRRCLGEASIGKDRVIGICCDGTSSTVIPVTETGTPLRRAILWMDGRAVEETEAINATSHPILRYAGGAESVEWMVPKALWLKRHEPRTYEEARYIVESTDWLTHKLTGRWTASLCNATCKWNYLRPLGGWDRSFFAAIGLEDLLVKWPQDVLPMSALVGPLSEGAAVELGLSPGIAVAQGGIDAHMGIFGLNALAPGRMAMILGTSVVCLALSAEPFYHPGLWGPYPEAVLPGLWLLEGGQVSAGSLVKWYRDHMGGTAVLEAERRGLSAYQLLDEEARRIPPGAEGLVVLDHWQGNRTPLRDPLSRGVISGLTLHHTPAHILRAIYEGICFGTRQIIEVFTSEGHKIEDMYVCGGGSRSRLWLEILSSVCRRPIVLTHTAESVCLGDAICAAVAAGAFKDLREAAEAMVKIKEVIEPESGTGEVYDFFYDSWVFP